MYDQQTDNKLPTPQDIYGAPKQKLPSPQDVYGKKKVSSGGGGQAGTSAPPSAEDIENIRSFVTGETQEQRQDRQRNELRQSQVRRPIVSVPKIKKEENLSLTPAAQEATDITTGYENIPLPSGYYSKWQQTHGLSEEYQYRPDIVNAQAHKYDYDTEPLKQIPLPQENLQTNDYARGVYADLLQNAAVKWYANNDKGFARDLKAKGVDMNDPDLGHRIPDAKAGQIMNAFVNSKNINDYISYEAPELIPAFMEAKDKNVVRNPNYGANQVANEVSRAIQKSGYNKAEPIFNYFSEGSREYANQVANELYKDDPNKMAIWDKMIKGHEEDYLDMPSFAEGVAGGAKGVLEGYKSTLTGGPFLKSKSQKIDEKLNKEATNVNANPDGVYKYARDVGNVIGLVGAVAGGAEVGGGLGLTPQAANMVSTAAAFGGQQFTEGFNKHPNNPVAAITSGALGTILYTALAKDIPVGKLGNVFNSVKPELEDAATKLASGEITKEAARLETNNIYKKALDAGLKGLAQNTRTSLELAGISGIQRGYDKLTGMSGDEFNKYHSDDDFANTFKSMFLTNAALAGAAGIGEVKARDAVLENSLYDAASNTKMYERKIDELKLDNPYMNDGEMRDNLKFLSETKGQLDAMGMKESDQKRYLVNSIKHKITEDKVKSIKDKTLKDGAQKNVSALELEKQRILNPDMGNKKFIEEMYNEGLLDQSPNSKRMLEDENGKFSEHKVGGYLKFIAQQANNLDENWNPHTTKAPDVSHIPEQVIEAANERWSKEIAAAKEKQPEQAKTEEFRPMTKGNGEPKVFYHSSDADFAEIKGQESVGYERKHSLSNRGIYFHEAPPQLAQYGKNKYEAHLDIRNPFMIDSRNSYISDVVNPYTGKNIEVEHISADDIKFLKEQGYDAVMAKYPAFQTVVFDPSQVRIIKKNNEPIKTEEQIKTEEPSEPKEKELGLSVGKVEPIRMTGTNIFEHAEDEHTANKIENGTSDSPLTERGRAQASNLGEVLGSDPQVTEILTGESARTIETSNIAAEKANEVRGGIRHGTPLEKAIGVKVTPMPLLTTLDVGDATGKPEGAFDEKYYLDHPDEPIPGSKTGETMGDFQKRSEEAYKFAYGVDKTKAMIISSKLIRAFKALAKTGGKWTPETTKIFLEENQIYPDAEKQDINQLKQEENAIPKREAVSLMNAKQNTNKDIIQGRPQEVSGIGGEAEANITKEVQDRRNKTLSNWLEAIKRNDTEAQRNNEKELFGEEIRQGGVLSNNDRNGEGLRTQMGNGEKNRQETKEEGTRTSQGRERVQQPSRQSTISNTTGTQQNPLAEENAGTKKQGNILNDAERREVVENARELSDMSDKSKTAHSIRALSEMLRRSENDNPRKNEISNLIIKTIKDALSIRKSAQVFVDETSRNRQEVGARIPESGKATNAQVNEATGEKTPVTQGEPYDKLVKEHEELIPILENGTPEERKKLADEQRAELEEYKKKAGGITEPQKEKPRIRVTADELERAQPPKEEEQFDFPASDESTGIAHAATEEVRDKYGLGEYERNNATDAELEQAAEEAIRKGYNPETVIAQMERGVPPNGVENFILKKYLATLSAQYEKNGSDATLDKIHRLVRATDKIGSLQSEAFRTRRGLNPVEDSRAEFFLEEMAANNDAPLTENQKSEANKAFETLDEKRKKLDEDTKAFEEKVAAFRAEQQLPKSKKTSKRSHQDLAKERNEILKSIGDKWANAGRDILSSDIPYRKQLAAIAPDVLKLARNLVEDGILELKDVVKNIQDKLKENKIEVEDKDIHDVIAGEYAEKKQTRREAAINYETLRQKAALLNKLERAESGRTKTEKQERKKNQDIAKFKKELGIDRLEQLEALKSRIHTDTKKALDILNKGDFAPPVEKKVPLLEDKELQRKFPKLFEQTRKSADEYLKVKRAISLRRLKQMYENKTPQEKTMEVFLKSLAIPRTLMASFDYSAPLRQGIVASISHPVMATEALKFMFRASKDENVYNRWLESVHNDPRWEAAQKTKLGITDPESLHVKAGEEVYQGSPYAEKIPIVGLGVKASERAYIGYLNHLRWNLFNMYADRFEDMGKTFENNPKLYEGISSMINSETGRGGMKGLENAAPVLNTILFASKLIASRLNLLGLSDIPNLATRAATFGRYGVDYGFYSKLPKELRWEAAKDMLRFIGVASATLALAKYLGAEVEDDPRSADFGKIHVGNTRWDIWGGFQPYARTIVQMLKRERKVTTTGQVKDINFSEPLGKFAWTKLAPVPGGFLNLAMGHDAAGQPVTITSQLISSVTPLLAQDIYQGIQDQGVKAIFTVGIPSAFGVGVQTYQNQNGASGSFKKISTKSGKGKSHKKSLKK